MTVRLWWMAGVCALGGVVCAIVILVFMRRRTQEPVAQASGFAIVIGDSKEIVAPPASATAGSIWIEFAVKYENRAQRSVWLHGYSADHVFYELETRSDDQDEWVDFGMGYCGTGAQML